MATIKDYQIFVVENNKVYNHLVSEYIKKQDFKNVTSILSGEECVELLEKGVVPDIVIQDYHLDGINGIEVLRKVKKINPKTEFIFLTSNENMDVAVNTIKFGAYDYIVKDKLALEKVVYKISKIVKILKLEKKNKQIRISMIIFSIFILILVIFSILYFVLNVFGVTSF